MKPPLILIHGYRGSPAGLSEIAEILKTRGYEVYNPSIPPFGDSKPLKDYTREAYADFIADFIKNQGIKKPVLIGHSMGSLVAAATAEKYPELLNNKLILLAPISVKPAAPIAILNPLVAKVPRRVVDTVSTAYTMIPSDLETTKKTLRLTHESSRLYTSKEDVVKAGVFSCNHAIDSFSFHKTTLLLAGARDHIVPRRKTERLALKLSETMPAEAVFIRGTGHLLNYEKPGETAEEIRHFLEN